MDSCPAGCSRMDSRLLRQYVHQAFEMPHPTGLLRRSAGFEDQLYRVSDAYLSGMLQYPLALLLAFPILRFALNQVDKVRVDLHTSLRQRGHDIAHGGMEVLGKEFSDHSRF